MSSKLLNRNRGGRPPFFETPEVLQQGVDEYFAQCVASEKAPTMSGLCLFLGFSRRDALLAYERRGEEFSDVVSLARLRMEDDRNQRLLLGQGSTTGAIFDLKNNFGWKDRYESQVGIDIDLTKLSDEQLQYIAKTGKLPPGV